MKRHVFIYFALLMITLILFSACSSIGGRIRRNEEGTSDSDAHKGTEGLELKFVKNNPPDKVYDTGSFGNEFPVLIEVKNKGAVPVGGDNSENTAWLILSGFDQNIVVGLNKWTKIPQLHGKNVYYLEGGYKIMNLAQGGDGGSVVLPQGVDYYKPTVQVTACYRYRTEANPVVCIDPDPYTSLEDKVCDVGDVMMSGGQGAPVGVTRVETVVMPGRMQFKIHVQNLGSGKVVKRDTVLPTEGLSACPFDLGYEDLNKIRYTIETSSSLLRDFRCEPQQDEFRLTDDRGFIFCSANVDTSEDTFSSPLLVTLDYGYMDSISMDVAIRTTDYS